MICRFSLEACSVQRMENERKSCALAAVRDQGRKGGAWESGRGRTRRGASLAAVCSPSFKPAVRPRIAAKTTQRLTIIEKAPTATFQRHKAPRPARSTGREEAAEQQSSRAAEQHLVSGRSPSSAAPRPPPALPGAPRESVGTRVVAGRGPRSSHERLPAIGRHDAPAVDRGAVAEDHRHKVVQRCVGAA